MLAFEYGLDVVLSVLGLATGPAELVMLEAQAAVAVDIAAENACDPDPCRTVEKYWLLAEPRVPPSKHPFDRDAVAALFSGRITAKTVKLFESALDTHRRIPAYKLAVFESCCRAYSAKQRSDDEAEQSQMRHKSALTHEVAGLRCKAADQWEDVLSHARRNKNVGRQIAASDYEPFLELLDREGFPEIELNVMRDYGLSDEDIDRVRRRILTEFDVRAAPRTVEEAILGKILAFRHSEFQCTCG